MKRALCWLLIALLLLTAAAQAAEPEDLMRVVNCKEWVSLREGPSTKAAQLAKVPKGAIVFDDHQSYGMFLGVRYGAKYGFILAPYLKYQSRALRVGSKGGAALRTGPSAKSRLVKRLKQGTRLLFVEDARNGYCYVCCGGTYGYVSCKALAAAKRAQGVEKRVTGCDSYITLREGPSTQSAELAKIPRSATVLSYGGNGFGMDYICYKGEYGFALNRYLKKVKAKPEANSKKKASGK